MRPNLVFMIALLLALPHPAFAQASSTLVSADPKAQYYLVKRAMQQMYERGSLHSNISRVGTDAYDLIHCERGSEFLGRHFDEGEPLVPLADLAADIVVWRNDLTRLGVPENIWRAALIEIEDSQLAMRLKEHSAQRGGFDTPSERSYNEQQRRLAAVLNQYRTQRGANLPPFQIEGGCGAGEVSVNIVAEPRNGRVFFIPVFFHELCKTQKLNPDDPAACNRWREAVEGALSDVAGDYLYRATWPDGATRNGSLSFTKLKDGQTVTIRKP